MSLQALLALAQDEAQIDGMKLPWTADRYRAFPTVGLLLGTNEGPGNVRFVNSGRKITQKFDGNVESDFTEVAFGSDYTWNRTGGMNFMEVPWRESRWSSSLFEHDIAFQSAGGYSGTSHSRSLYNVLAKADLDFALGPIKKLADKVWRTPDPEMDADGDGALPMRSLACFLNTWKLAHGTAGDGIPPGFLSQQGLDPADHADPNRPGESQACVHQLGYSVSNTGVVGSGNTSVAAGHLLETMSRAVRFTGYDTVPTVGMSEAGEMMSGLRTIITSDGGYTQLEQVVRAHGGDMFRIVKPGLGVVPTFSDFPVAADPALRNKALYPDVVSGSVGSAATRAMVTEDDANGYTGGRFYLPDAAMISFIAHPERYFKVKNWYALDQINPDKIVKHGGLWGNLMAHAFRTSAVVYPTANQSSYVA